MCDKCIMEYIKLGGSVTRWQESTHLSVPISTMDANIYYVSSANNNYQIRVHRAS